MRIASKTAAAEAADNNWVYSCFKVAGSVENIVETAEVGDPLGCDIKSDEAVEKLAAGTPDEQSLLKLPLLAYPDRSDLGYNRLHLVRSLRVARRVQGARRRCHRERPPHV